MKIKKIIKVEDERKRNNASEMSKGQTKRQNSFEMSRQYGKSTMGNHQKKESILPDLKNKNAQIITNDIKRNNSVLNL